MKRNHCHHEEFLAACTAAIENNGYHARDQLRKHAKYLPTILKCFGGAKNNVQKYSTSNTLWKCND